MHHIQQKILNKLLYAEQLGYARIRPAGVESNHFSYHLEQLVHAGLVAKHDKQYSLAPEGLKLVDRLSQQKMTDRLQSHIVTAIDITNNAGQTLVYKRVFQPYIHRIGFPLGKTHYEESVQTAATRELQEKTGLTDVPLTHRGMVYLESKIAGITISKVLYHVFQGKSEATPRAPDPVRGSSMWMDDSLLTAHELMPGFRAIKKLLTSPDPDLFFTEICEDLPE